MNSRIQDKIHKINRMGRLGSVSCGAIGFVGRPIPFSEKGAACQLGGCVEPSDEARKNPEV